MLHKSDFFSPCWRFLWNRKIFLCQTMPKLKPKIWGLLTPIPRFGIVVKLTMFHVVSEVFWYFSLGSATKNQTWGSRGPTFPMVVDAFSLYFDYIFVCCFNFAYILLIYLHVACILLIFYIYICMFFRFCLDFA